MLPSFEYLNTYASSNDINRWIVNAVDIIGEENQKIIFVYFGTQDSRAIEKLRHFYDKVLHFDEFSDYLSKELVLPTLITKFSQEESV